MERTADRFHRQEPSQLEYPNKINDPPNHTQFLEAKKNVPSNFDRLMTMTEKKLRSVSVPSPLTTILTTWCCESVHTCICFPQK